MARAVCLAGCQFGEPTLTHKHEAYARFAAPMIHYIAEDAPREEVAKFLAELVLYDGSVSNYVHLAVGNFEIRDQSKALPLDLYDKLALFIIFAAKYGVGVKEVYIKHASDNADAVKNAGLATIYFDRGYAAGAFAEAWASLHADWRFGREQGLYTDHIFKKLEKLRRYVEEWAKSVEIEHVLYNLPGVDPRVEVRFKDEAGREIAHINVGWTGESLLAYFGGAREKAERLAAILNALGAEVEAREYGGDWYVKLYTDSIAAIRRPEWLNAVRALVEELYKNGRITKEQRDRLIREIEAGPNAVEVAGVEMNVRLEEEKSKSGRSKTLKIIYLSLSPEAFKAAVNALKAAGFEEGVHFTAKAPEGGEKGYIRLRVPAGLWKLEELRQQGVGWAKKALDRLEDIARARGFYDVLEEYLRPAKEAETVDPRNMVAEDKERGIKAVIKDVKLEWDEGRPRIVVEYEARGKKGSFDFVWGATAGVRASVWLNYEKSAVLAALTGHEKLKGKKGNWVLTSKHFFAFTKYKGVGWALLWWYATVTSRDARI